MLSEEPTYSRSEVAKTFFGRTKWWLIQQERKPLVLKSGRLVEIHVNETGRRVYTLQDIENIAHALVLRGNLRPDRASKIFMLVKLVSELWESKNG